MPDDHLCAIITGASSGLGAATAKLLARPGTSLVLNYLSNREGVQQAAAECRNLGAEVTVVQGDVSVDGDCRRVAAAADSFRSVHALINNAGTTKHVAHQDLDALSFEDFQNIYATNTIAAYQMIRASRSLLEAGATSSGKASAVVNVSSIAGLSGIGSSVAYVASKGALNSMTLSLARALAPAIRVNAICPGYMDTPWFEKGFGAETAERVREHVRANMPLNLAPTSDDVAELVCFLASSRSGIMTGELVRMDAGLHLVSLPAT
jgi:NAD(P)-dependent dehydrogenase (short-subunit alcohol dehydrogenase family)